MSREAHNVSETQLNDFRRCFNHFDRKRLRRLDLSEFKACLVSLGYNIPNNPQVSPKFIIISDLLRIAHSCLLNGSNSIDLLQKAIVSSPGSIYLLKTLLGEF